MTNAMVLPSAAGGCVSELMGQSEPQSAVKREREQDLAPYRRQTIALLRRYGRASIEVGRLPSLLGREFFRTRVTSCRRGGFEDIVIFVADMERAIEKLDPVSQRLLGMNVLDEYTVDEVARLLNYNSKTIRRLLRTSIDDLTQLLLIVRLIDRMDWVESCQEGKKSNYGVSNSKEAKYKCGKHVHSYPSDLIS